MKPLEGTRVVEVSMWGYVPSCGAVLADWGASVVKVEPPEGDPIRGLSFGGVPASPSGTSYMAELFNRGKRSVCLDLRTEQGLDNLLRLVDEADVLLVSLLAETRRTLGIDCASIRARNPRVIYASGTGYGVHGPEAGKGGFDAMTFWARGGVAAAVTPEGAQLPSMMPTAAFGDVLSGLVLAGGISAAIAHRERTGEALEVTGSLLSTAMWSMQAGIVASALLNSDVPPKLNRTMTPNPLVVQYRTGDDRFVALNMLQGDRFWPGFCEAIGRPDLIADPRFATGAARAENIGACFEILDAEFAKRPLEDWQRMLDTQTGQWDVLKVAGELRRDPQALANGFIQPLELEGHRQVDVVPAPIQFDQVTPTPGPPPVLGADTDAVLTELGMTYDEIIEAKVAGAVG
jgi:crotonobetainyl-CoA:carnitine CoA-transferase CaiB-like acyl-CoA transferase